MPTPSITSNFTGEHAGKYINAALQSGSTIGNEEVTILPNVRYKTNVTRLTLGDVIADATCNFTDGSSLALVDREIAPKEMQVNLSLCKQDLLDSWEALQMGFSAYKEIPQNFTDYLLAYVGEKVGAEAENYIWTGAAGTSGQFGGFNPILVAGDTSIPAGQKINPGAPSTINSTNVLVRLGAMLDALPTSLYGKNDLRFYIAPNVARAYMRVLGGFASGGVGANGYQNEGSVGFKPLNFDGIDMVMCPGLTASTMLLTRKSNLFFGTGLMNDWQEARVLDMADITGSNNYRVIMRFSAGTQIGILEDLVLDGLGAAPAP
jgi:hypothetical protein